MVFINRSTGEQEEVGCGYPTSTHTMAPTTTTPMVKGDFEIVDNRVIRAIHSIYSLGYQG